MPAAQTRETARPLSISALAFIANVSLGAESSPISAERIKADVKQLASDEFLGRGPGEPGDEKTVAYLASVFEKAGLEPGGEDGGWFQKVPLVRLDRLPGAKLTLKVGDAEIPLEPGRNVSLGLRNEGPTTLKDAPLVFGGWGVVDPKLGWDAYEGVDLSGKIVVLLANDPDFEGGRDLGFEGRRMAYAGRTGVKYRGGRESGRGGRACDS